MVSAILFTHTREAGKTDDLAKSIHYGEVSRQIKEYMENHTCKLLETVAEGLAEELLLTRPLLEQVQLEIKKPWLPWAFLWKRYPWRLPGDGIPLT